MFLVCVAPMSNDLKVVKVEWSVIMQRLLRSARDKLICCVIASKTLQRQCG